MQGYDGICQGKGRVHLPGLIQKRTGILKDVRIPVYSGSFFSVKNR